MDALESLQRELVFQADIEDYYDARLSSIQYLRAAGHLDLIEHHVLAMARRLRDATGGR
jgi:hypothetical protein